MRIKNLLYILTFFLSFSVFAQKADTTGSKLMQDEVLQMDATDAMNHMYNFKFDLAEAKFKELMKMYPEHPLPYYLMGLSNWWKMMPYGEDDPHIDEWEPLFDKYMDLAIDKAEVMYKKNEEDMEATFFLCAAHGLIARHYAENGQEMRSINNTRKTFSYFKKLNEKSDLSPEFMFGSALFNYYAAWFREEYPILKPVLALFPKGDKGLGIKQLKHVYYNAFWTRTEAQYFLMRIYFNEEEDDKSAYEYSMYLAKTFPDNPYFQRIYARICYVLGYTKECKEVSENILYKINIGMPGYEETSGRYAGFFLGSYYEYKDPVKAKEYFEKSKVFAEKSNSTDQRYYIFTLNSLAKIADKNKDVSLAREHYENLLEHADNKDAKLENVRNAAKTYLKNTETKKKGWFW